MPHLHLPLDHSDADLILAASVAVGVGSEDLYIAWTHHAGPGAVPEIEALVRHERRSPVASVLDGVVAGLMALWHGFTHGPAATAGRAPARRPAQSRTEEPQA
jgi:hypothetical protein